jgi:hypothetical protein
MLVESQLYMHYEQRIYTSRVNHFNFTISEYTNELS